MGLIFFKFAETLIESEKRVRLKDANVLLLRVWDRQVQMLLQLFKSFSVCQGRPDECPRPSFDCQKRAQLLGIVIPLDSFNAHLPLTLHSHGRETKVTREALLGLELTAKTK